MITISGSVISDGIRTLEDAIPYVAGLYKTTYAGYFNDVPSFFATATPTTYGTNPATSVQTTAISEAGSDDGSNFSCQWLGYFLPSTTETYTLGSEIIQVNVVKKVVTNYEYETTLNESKRNIKILNKIYADTLEAQFLELMK